MRKLLFSLTILFSISAFSCPDLNGEYEMVHKVYSLKIKINQKSCKELKMVFHSQPYFSKYLMDKKSYEETYDSKMNSYAEKPVSNATEDFVKAFYQGDRLVVQDFNVEDSTYQKCLGKYSFSDFNCQKMEFSLGYDKSIKSYTWRRIGYWRGGDGSYQDDEFIMKKTK